MPRFAGPFLYSSAARLSALLYSTQLLLLLGSGLRLDSLFRPALSYRVIQSGQLGRYKHFCSFHRFSARPAGISMSSATASFSFC
jgi:hypothetical protein